jgi:hypothetical protein
MKLIKKGTKHFLRIELERYEWKYLKDMMKYELPGIKRNNIKYLRNMLSLHIKTVYVMTTAMMLKENGKIKSSAANQLFSDLDKATHNYEKILRKYFRRFSKIPNLKK